MPFNFPRDDGKAGLLITSNFDARKRTKVVLVMHKDRTRRMG